VSGFLARAGHLLGRAVAALGLGDHPQGVTPTPPAGTASLPTHVVLLSPARRRVRLLSPAHKKVKWYG
jgi:hypothetical protein